MAYLKQKRSLNYRFTVDSKDDETLLNLREQIKNHNQNYFVKRANAQKRIKLQGRGERTRPALADGRHPRAYDQSLPLRHATSFDVYVYG